ncbi:MAG: patatin-like phospholipase family protein [Nitrospira sp.]
MSTEDIPLSRRALLKTIGIGGSAWALAQASLAKGEGMSEAPKAYAGRKDEFVNVLREQREETFEDKVREGIALCVSGGGYRAMLFHLGTFWRLNQAGLLPELQRISSVSGGSITAGVLGYAWGSLLFKEKIAQNFIEKVVEPIRKLAGETIDVGAIIKGILLPGTIGQKVRDAYEDYLFGHATLQDLPDTPRFVINATNIQSGVLWRFSKPYMIDYRVGQVKEPNVLLATAVAASSAFPPVLSPVELDLEPGQCVDMTGTDLHRKPYTNRVVLGDGGIYDNLGLQTVLSYETILVSDAGQKMGPEEDPSANWAWHTVRVMNVIDNQVRSLRKRQIIKAYETGERKGAYWGIGTDIRNYAASNKFECPLEQTTELAHVPTRLKEIEPQLQERLINWGFAVCDAALRTHVWPDMNKPDALPYPASGI